MRMKYVSIIMNKWFRNENLNTPESWMGKAAFVFAVQLSICNFCVSHCGIKTVIVADFGLQCPSCFSTWEKDTSASLVNKREGKVVTFHIASCVYCSFLFSPLFSFSPVVCRFPHVNVGTHAGVCHVGKQLTGIFSFEKQLVLQPVGQHRLRAIYLVIYSAMINEKGTCWRLTGCL